MQEENDQYPAIFWAVRSVCPIEHGLQCREVVKTKAPARCRGFCC